MLLLRAYLMISKRRRKILSNAERLRILNKKRKEQHRCIQCGEQDERTLAGKVRCEFCSKKQKLWYRENKLRKMNERAEK